MVRSPDVDRAVEVLDGRVERVEGDMLLVEAADAAAVNLRLVAAGVRVSEFAPERRSLEDLVLAVTGSGSDRVDRGDDRVGQAADSDGDAGQAEGDPK
jgi:ABC-2 type transport system ATP-binding protein